MKFQSTESEHPHTKFIGESWIAQFNLVMDWSILNLIADRANQEYIHRSGKSMETIGWWMEGVPLKKLGMADNWQKKKQISINS